MVKFLHTYTRQETKVAILEQLSQSEGGIAAHMNLPALYEGSLHRIPPHIESKYPIRPPKDALLAGLALVVVDFASGSRLVTFGKVSSSHAGVCSRP